MLSRIVSTPQRTWLVVAKQHASTSLRFQSTQATSGRFFPQTDTDKLMRQRKSSSTSREQCQPAAFNKVAFLGAGNMAQAILHPVIATGLQPANQVAVFDHNLGTLDKLQQQHADLQVANSVQDLVNDADLLVCAVKPQNISQRLLEEIRTAPHRASHGTFLSVLAGVPLDTFHDTGYDKIVRSMPNTPAMIGRGMTVWCATNALTTKERERIQTILSCLGESMYVDDENQVDMSTSISGSGPAYIFSLMEDMIDAGVHMGFPRDKATRLVYHTLLGSTLYAMETGDHPAILRNNVTSPNGTTASAIYELEQGGFRTAVKDAMWACYRRSLEMGGHESNVGPGRSAATEERILEQWLDPQNNDTQFQMTIEKKQQQPSKSHHSPSNASLHGDDQWAA